MRASILPAQDYWKSQPEMQERHGATLFSRGKKKFLNSNRKFVPNKWDFISGTIKSVDLPLERWLQGPYRPNSLTRCFSPANIEDFQKLYSALTHVSPELSGHPYSQRTSSTSSFQGLCQNTVQLPGLMNSQVSLLVPVNNHDSKDWKADKESLGISKNYRERNKHGRTDESFGSRSSGCHISQHKKNNIQDGVDKKQIVVNTANALVPPWRSSAGNDLSNELNGASKDLKHSDSAKRNPSKLKVDAIMIQQHDANTDTDRLGPDPSSLPKAGFGVLKPPISVTKNGGFSQDVQHKFDCPTNKYENLTFSISPHPSALPLPKFSLKAKTKIADSPKDDGIDRLATRDLRRLLGLE